jgi:hypothetical protein
MALACTGVMRSKPILDTASRIQSERAGFNVSQARGLALGALALAPSLPCKLAIAQVERVIRASRDAGNKKFPEKRKCFRRSGHLVPTTIRHLRIHKTVPSRATPDLYIYRSIPSQTRLTTNCRCVFLLVLLMGSALASHFGAWTCHRHPVRPHQVDHAEETFLAQSRQRPSLAVLP